MVDKKVNNLEEDHIKEALTQMKDPYEGTKISILCPCRDFEDFSLMVKNLLLSSNNFNDVEILLKIDNGDEAEKYHRLLDDSIFKYKILIFPHYNRRMTNHIVYNDLYSISNGRLIWAIGPDCRIVNGDWYKTLSNILNENQYKDNIYNIAIPMDNGKGYKQICGINIVTREWCEVLGCVSPLANVDRWLSELSKEIARHRPVQEIELLSHYPKGHRTLSKRQRKVIYRPMLKQAIQTFRKRLET